MGGAAPSRRKDTGPAQPAHDADARLIERFLEMLAADRGAAVNTRIAYARDLAQASQGLAAHGGLVRASSAALSGLAAQWHDLSASSLSRKLSAIAGFYRFCEEEGLRPDNPSGDIARPAARRSLPRILSHDDVARLFTHAESRAASPA
ncbi:MAG: site-specific integrase, partial [Sphingopyxis sp.]|nr:site-specific integrase [Sphingopyxis sp.]